MLNISTKVIKNLDIIFLLRMSVWYCRLLVVDLKHENNRNTITAVKKLE